MNIKEYISGIVNECVQENQNNLLRESIRPMIAEAVEEMGKENNGKIKVGALVKKLMQNPEFKQKATEYLKKEDGNFDGWANSLNGKKYSSLDNMSDGSKRRTVSQLLKDKKIDYAPIAYKLWPDMSEDAARSWFSKKVDGKNESFTDEEISKVYSMLMNIMTE